MKYRITCNLNPIYKYQLKHIILKWLKINIYGLLSALLMLIIFLFSSQTGNESYHLSSELEKFCSSIFGIGYIVHTFNIRKIAHFILYALLGTCLFTHIRYTYYFSNKYKYYIVPLMITFIYAITDELHQLFISGRSGNAYDVFIDVSGCLLALVINFIVITILEKRDLKLKQKLSEIYNN